MKILITGASSGMGRDMALYLLENNHEVYVVSRNRKVLKDIYKDYNKVKIYEYDLLKEDNCYNLYNELKKENIDILINNAGFGDAGNFSKTELTKELDMINLNINAYHILTKLFLQDFIKKDSGHILNVSSMAGFIPGPYMATYYATKNYVTSLTLAIYQELKRSKSKVKVSLFCPGPVNTNFNNVANVHFTIKGLDSKKASKYAIDNMFKNKLLIIPNNMKLVRILTKISPIKLTLYINSFIQEKKFNK